MQACRQAGMWILLLYQKKSINMSPWHPQVTYAVPSPAVGHVYHAMPSSPLNPQRCPTCWMTPGYMLVSNFLMTQWFIELSGIILNNPKLHSILVCVLNCHKVHTSVFPFWMTWIVFGKCSSNDLSLSSESAISTTQICRKQLRLRRFSSKIQTKSQKNVHEKVHWSSDI